MNHRHATSDDYSEVFRLIKLLWSGMDLPVISGRWEENATVFLNESAAKDTARLLVVDHPDQSGELVATGMATILYSAPTFWLPNGKMGYVQWFYTEPEFRRRGIATAMLTDLIAWFEANDVKRAQLHGDVDALPLYERQGFQPTMYANYWWRSD